MPHNEAMVIVNNFANPPYDTFTIDYSRQNQIVPGLPFMFAVSLDYSTIICSHYCSSAAMTSLLHNYSIEDPILQHVARAQWVDGSPMHCTSIGHLRHSIRIDTTLVPRWLAKWQTFATQVCYHPHLPCSDLATWCVLCMLQREETNLHIYWVCPFVQDLWQWLFYIF